MVYRRNWLRAFFPFFAVACASHLGAQTGVLSLSSGTGAPGASLALSVSLQTHGTLPAALQWDLIYPSGDLSVAAGTYYTTGAAASAAGKSVICQLVGPGDVRCLVTGLDITPIGAGALAGITFQIANTTDVSAPVNLTAVVASDATGTALPFTGTGGAVTITQAGPPPPTPLVSLSCAPVSLTPPAAASCTAALSANTTTATAVTLVSASPTLVTVPSAVTIPAGYNNAAFSASAIQTVNSTMQVMVNASANGASQNAALTLTPGNSGPPPALQINGNSSEVSGETNGSVVTPSAGPSGFLGTVVVNGSGSVAFTPAQSGNGVYFQSCCGSNNNAYYKFTGAPIGNVFTTSQGQVSFDLTSRYSWTQRKALSQSRRSAFDVRDGSGIHEFAFFTQSVYGTLEFVYSAGGVTVYYNVPKGTEDTLFGSGVSMHVTITWSGNASNLYLNHKLVKTATYIAPSPNWSSASIFDIGAQEYLKYGACFTSDDIISNFAAYTSVQPVP